MNKTRTTHCDCDVLKQGSSSACEHHGLLNSSSCIMLNHNSHKHDSSSACEHNHSIDGGAKNDVISTLQNAINEDLRRTIPLEAFIQEKIQLMVKNTVGIRCKKCGSDDVFCESRQIRSADEATSKIYTCLNCGNKWRVD